MEPVIGKFPVASTIHPKHDILTAWLWPFMIASHEITFSFPKEISLLYSFVYRSPNVVIFPEMTADFKGTKVFSVSIHQASSSQGAMKMRSFELLSNWKFFTLHYCFSSSSKDFYPLSAPYFSKNRNRTAKMPQGKLFSLSGQTVVPLITLLEVRSIIQLYQWLYLLEFYFWFEITIFPIIREF